MTTDLDRLVDDAAAGLDSATGGTAVCTFTKAGTPVPGIKYAEGRWAALREVQRRVAKGASYEDALRQTHAVWSLALQALQERGAGTDWISYRTGGTDALDDLAASQPSVATP